MLLLASGKQARREGEVFFLIPGYCRACGESRDGDEGQKVNERGFLQPRKEGREFPLASDCLTCKNVAFVAELYSHFLAVCLTSCLPLPPSAPSLPRVSAFNPLWLDSVQRQNLIGLSDAV